MYISLSDCARKYNIDKTVLRNLCQNGELQAKKCGKGWRIVEDNIEEKSFAKYQNTHKKAKIDWNIVAHSNNVCAGKKQKPSKQKINYALRSEERRVRERV